MKRKIFSTIFFLFTAFFLISANSNTSRDTNNDGKPDEWYELVDGKVNKIMTDRDFDGRVDAVVVYSKGEMKKYEEMDFNYDGKMDDFYYYEAGLLTKREIDSDFDGQVDLWVYLTEGQYITRYEKDLNADGIPDKIKDYTK